MSRQKIIILISLIFAFLIIILLLFQRELLLGWIQSEWRIIVIVSILAVITGLILKFIYGRYYHESRISQTTMIMKPRKLLAKLILPDKNHLTITQYERIFGREDFLGVLVSDQLLFIGKEHFKLTRLDDGFYIEDLNSKNGTEVNGQNIKDLGKIKLKNNDQIVLANILTLSYYEEKIE